MAVNDFGYLDDKRKLKDIQQFEQLTRAQNPSEHRLLFCDNYGSHFFRELLEYAKEHHILLYGLRLHSSHFMQPFDGVAF